MKMETEVREATVSEYEAKKGVVWEVKNLTKLFPIKGGFLSSLMGKEKHVHAVNDVQFNIYEKEILGIVGESGCGKTTAGRLLVRLETPTKGSMLFRGEEIGDLKGRKLKSFRRNVQMVFQDPYESLNPRLMSAMPASMPLMRAMGRYNCSKPGWPLFRWVARLNSRWQSDH